MWNKRRLHNQTRSRPQLDSQCNRETQEYSVSDDMSACNRYTLTKKLKKIFETRRIPLVCKLCDCPIQVGEQIESKQQSKGKIKLYHSICYDDSHIDVPD